MIISDKGPSVCKEVLVLHARATQVFVCVCWKGKGRKKGEKGKQI